MSNAPHGGPSGAANEGPEADRPARSTLWQLLLIIPFVATLWVPFFNMRDPELFGFPFFYWYQLMCVPLSALIIFIVYKAES
ncbi:MAG: hypothetical protein B7Z78_01685 [Rhodospirillales bacterium 20-60-12]|nr:MAG: hypothetical protein B7Z78_01685 [Rhodospirillales bacterium 20-60-12]